MLSENSVPWFICIISPAAAQNANIHGMHTSNNTYIYIHTFRKNTAQRTQFERQTYARTLNRQNQKYTNANNDNNISNSNSVDTRSPAHNHPKKQKPKRNSFRTASKSITHIQCSNIHRYSCSHSNKNSNVFTVYICS